MLRVCVGSVSFFVVGLDSVIQRNDTSKSSTVPEVVYPVRTADNHGAASNAAVDRNTVTGSVSSAASAAAGGGGGTVAIGQSLFYTDFPPKEYGHSAGMGSVAFDFWVQHIFRNVRFLLFVANPQDRCRLPSGTQSCIVCSCRFCCTVTEMMPNPDYDLCKVRPEFHVWN